MSAFDPARALSFAAFVDISYAMYGNGTAVSVHPPVPAPGLPHGYTLTSYITMLNQVNDSNSRVFFGFIATGTNLPSVVAIRGTVGGIEWIKDAEVWPPLAFEPVANSGHVVKGFDDFYRTLVLSDALAGGGAPEVATLNSQAHVNGGKPFAQQVSDALASGGAAGGAAPQIVVAGHSLGGALTTLYVMDNAFNAKEHVTEVYTLASPMVGDQGFVTMYDQQCLKDGIASYRIANHADLVPTLPLQVFGWRPVDTAIVVDSHDTVFTIAHAHQLSTYEALLKGYTVAAGP